MGEGGGGVCVCVCVSVREREGVEGRRRKIGKEGRGGRKQGREDSRDWKQHGTVSWGAAGEKGILFERSKKGTGVGKRGW